MLMQEALKMLMKVNRMTQKRAAEYLGTYGMDVHRTVNNHRLEVSKAVELLNFMGYELIIREKVTGRRSEDEIIVNNIPEFSDKQIREFEQEPVKEQKKTIKFSHKDYVMEKLGGKKWASRVEAADILGISYPTVMKRYGNVFVGNRIPAAKLIEILDDGSVVTINQKIKEKPAKLIVDVDDDVADTLMERISEYAPGKLFLTRSDIAKITGYSRQTVYTRFGKYFVNNTLTVNEFIAAFQLEGMELK